MSSSELVAGQSIVPLMRWEEGKVQEQAALTALDISSFIKDWTALESVTCNNNNNNNNNNNDDDDDEQLYISVCLSLSTYPAIIATNEWTSFKLEQS